MKARKIDPSEAVENKNGGVREAAKQAIRDLLAEFAVGDRVEINLEDGEKKINLTKRLHNVAAEQGLILKMVRVHQKDTIIFDIEESNPAA